jgi:hypothetical protein
LPAISASRFFFNRSINESLGGASAPTPDELPAGNDESAATVDPAANGRVAGGSPFNKVLPTNTWVVRPPAM